MSGPPKSTGLTVVRPGDRDPGTVLVIPANERYALDAGDAPLTFAVIRPRKADYDGPA